MKQNENQKRSGHLDYLLTAYVFDSLSAAGQKEVEEHLAACAECRAQLDLLRQTLGLAEKALDSGGTTYVFEDRRRERVLEAARRRNTQPRIQWSWKLPLVAALLMVTTLVGILASLMHSSRERRATESVAASKSYAEAEDIYRRTDNKSDSGLQEYTTTIQPAAAGRRSAQAEGFERDERAVGDAQFQSGRFQKMTEVEKSKNVEIIAKVQKEEAPLAPVPGAAPSPPPSARSFGLSAPPSKPNGAAKEENVAAEMLQTVEEEKLPAAKTALAVETKPSESAPSPVPELPILDPRSGGKRAKDELAAGESQVDSVLAFESKSPRHPLKSANAFSSPTPTESPAPPQYSLYSFSGGSCFPAGTPVLTEDGPRAIETITAGARVRACDPHSGEWSFKSVVQPLCHAYSGDLVGFTTGSVSVESTGNHPFWVESGASLAQRPEVRDIPAADRALFARGRWVEARDLRAGDVLCSERRPLRIEALAVRQVHMQVYNLTVAERHTYAVSEAGILVHNKESAAPPPVEYKLQPAFNSEFKSTGAVVNDDPAWMKNSPHHVDIPPMSSTPVDQSQRTWAAKTPPAEPTVAAKAGLDKALAALPEPALSGLTVAPKTGRVFRGTLESDSPSKSPESRDRELQERTELAAVKDDPNSAQDEKDGRHWGRKEVAIAAKDAEIRKQEELIQQEREGRAHLQQANEGLAGQTDLFSARRGIAIENPDQATRLNRKLAELNQQLDNSGKQAPAAREDFYEGKIVLGSNVTKAGAKAETPTQPVETFLSTFDGDLDTNSVKGLGREPAKSESAQAADIEKGLQSASGGAISGEKKIVDELSVEFQGLDPRALKSDFGDVGDIKKSIEQTPPTSHEVADVIIPSDILEKAELGDHFETISPDKPDTSSKFGKNKTRGKVIVRQKEEFPAGASKAASALRGDYGVALNFDEKGKEGRKEQELTSPGIRGTQGKIEDKLTESLGDKEKPVAKLEKEVEYKFGVNPQPGPGVAGGDETVTVIDKAFAEANGEATSTPKAGYEFSLLPPKKVETVNGKDLSLGYAMTWAPAAYDASGRDAFIISNSGTIYQSDPAGGGVAGNNLDDLTGVGGAASAGTGTGGGFGSQRKKVSAKEINDTIAWYYKEAEKGSEVDEHGIAPPARLSGRYKTPNNAMVDVNAIEGLLRGYRHLLAENPKLTWNEFLRRPAPVPAVAKTDEGLDEDAYIEKYGTRPFVDCARDHLSTFGLDVDTASYALTRSRLRQNELPDPEAVRVEEFLNYFKHPYTVTGDDAFGVFAEGAPSPFAGAQSVVSGALKSLAAPTELLKIGIKSREARPDERKPAMLTFVVDTSGSMTRQDRLDLVRAALKSLVEKLNPEDAISIIGFNDQAELSLPRTQAKQKQRILDAIDALTSKGGTNVEAGLTMAYRLADESFSPDAVNRVILCSDGVANIGAKGPDEILKLVKVFAGRGIDLCTIGFGMGKYNDQMMVKLADNGNGSCHFVDSRAEADKIFSEQLPPHLNVLARDAKAQIDFNPDVVERYRLLGYEKRKIADKDFRNDKIDAGEVAHNTLITVLYEIQRKPTAHGPLGKVFLRWKDAGYRHLPVVERNYPLSEGVVAGDAQHASAELRFLACVARFAELLRGSKWVQDSSYAAVLAQLQQLPPEFKTRPDWTEVRELVARAQELSVKQWAAELRK